MGNPEEQPKERWPVASTTAATWRFRWCPGQSFPSSIRPASTPTPKSGLADSSAKIALSCAPSTVSSRPTGWALTSEEASTTLTWRWPKKREKASFAPFLFAWFVEPTATTVRAGALVIVYAMFPGSAFLYLYGRNLRFSLVLEERHARRGGALRLSQVA